MKMVRDYSQLPKKSEEKAGSPVSWFCWWCSWRFGCFQSFNPFPLRICCIHFSILDSRVLDCLAAEK